MPAILTSSASPTVATPPQLVCSRVWIRTAIPVPDSEMPVVSARSRTPGLKTDAQHPITPVGTSSDRRLRYEEKAPAHTPSASARLEDRTTTTPPNRSAASTIRRASGGGEWL